MGSGGMGSGGMGSGGIGLGLSGMSMGGSGGAGSENGLGGAGRGSMSDAEHARQMRMKQLNEGAGPRGAAGGSAASDATSTSNIRSGQPNQPTGARTTRSVTFADDVEPVPVKPATTTATAAGAPGATAASAAATTPHSHYAAGADSKMCSACQHSADGSHCEHTFCVSCVQQYFPPGSTHPLCPICGSTSDTALSSQSATQPKDGVMLVTYDNSFRLPGYETSSRGTIIITYCFPPGTQTDNQPHPGQRYNGLTKTAFLPLTLEGTTVVDQLQCAFDARLLFAMASTDGGKTDEITWNGILHKTNIFGGPQQAGYPDGVYLQRVQRELAAKGFN